MSNNKQGFHEHLARKKRIQRMKTGLVWFILTWMLAWTFVSVMLIAKVNSLQKQIDIITKNTIRSRQVEQQENQAGNSDHVLKYDPSIQTDDKADEQNTDADNGSGKTAGITGQASAPPEAEKKEQDRKVYLTFDDGPSRNTEKILSILDQYQIKASFFVTGREDKKSLELYKEIVDRGHTIGMHSYSHKYDLVYESLETFKQDFKQIQDKIQEAAGINCRLYRFPGGSSNQVSKTPMRELIRFLNEEEITYFDWNVECGDASSKDFTADELAENVLNDVVKHHTSVVLLHDADNKSGTIEALPVIIEELLAMDAQILPIDDSTALIQHVSADSVD